MSYKKNQREKKYQLSETEAANPISESAMTTAELSESEYKKIQDLNTATVAIDAVDHPCEKVGVVDVGTEYDGLNVREYPGGDVVEILKNGTKVTILSDDDDDRYYKIITESGIEGYCMKGYILIVNE